MHNHVWLQKPLNFFYFPETVVLSRSWDIALQGIVALQWAGFTQLQYLAVEVPMKLATGDSVWNGEEPRKQESIFLDSSGILHTCKNRSIRQDEWSGPAPS